MPSRRRREDEEIDPLVRAPEADASRSEWLGGRRSLSDLGDADPQTRAMVLGRLQQGAGNASVARIVAGLPETGDPREVAEALEMEAMEDAVVEPHAGGDDSDAIAVAEQAKEAGADGESEVPETVLPPSTDLAAPEPTNAQTPPPGTGIAAPAWPGTTKPADNPAYAKWILEAETQGFVTFLDYQWMMKKGQAAVEFSPKLQMEAIQNGQTIVLADGSAGAPVLGALESIYAIVKGRADRWQADQNKPKDKLMVGWVVRDDRSSGYRGHTYGESADLAGGYDWNGANGPTQVMQTLDDLHAAFGGGTYGIGLPFQGDFFPPEEEMVGRVERALVAAGTGGTPADLVSPPSLVRYHSTRRPLKWDAAAKPNPRYVISGSQPNDAETRLKSAALKAKIADLRKKGLTIMVFPDNKNHIHITRT